VHARCAAQRGDHQSRVFREGEQSTRSTVCLGFQERVGAEGVAGFVDVERDANVAQRHELEWQAAEQSPPLEELAVAGRGDQQAQSVSVSMAAEDLRLALERLPPAWRGQCFERVGSTQDEARRAAAQGAPSRSVFVADYQSAGRGREGRVWQAPPSAALLLSILLREAGDAPRPWRSTALASVALAEAIEAAAPTLNVGIKWPNDLMLDGRKVAGILAESWSDRAELAIAVGIGVNVNTPAEELAAVPAPAISLSMASGDRVDRGALLLAFVARLDAWLGHSESELQDTWQSRLWGRGQRLRLVDIGVDEEVVVLGATLDGALRVRLADGHERVTSTGELLL